MSKIVIQMFLLFVLAISSSYAVTYIKFDYMPLKKESLKDALDKFVLPKYHHRAYLGMISRIQIENRDMKGVEFIKPKQKIILFVDETIADAPKIQEYIEILADYERPAEEIAAQRNANTPAEASDEVVISKIYNRLFKPAPWQFDLGFDFGYKYKSFQTNGPSSIFSTNQQESQYHNNTMNLAGKLRMGIFSWLDLSLKTSYSPVNKTIHTAKLINNSPVSEANRDDDLDQSGLGDLEFEIGIRPLSGKFSLDFNSKFYYPIGGTDYLPEGLADQSGSNGSLIPVIELAPILYYQVNDKVLTYSKIILQYNMGGEVTYIDSFGSDVATIESNLEYGITLGTDYQIGPKFSLGLAANFHYITQSVMLVDDVRYDFSTKSIFGFEVNSTYLINPNLYFKLSGEYKYLGDQIYQVSDNTLKTVTADRDYLANISVGFLF